MNPHNRSLLRAAAVAATLFTVAPGAGAANSAPADDPAVQILAESGTIPVAEARRRPGWAPVHVGALRADVTRLLGNPRFRAGAGCWAYDDYAVDDSQATGVLLVRFAGQRVTELSLIESGLARPFREESARTLRFTGRR